MATSRGFTAAIEALSMAYDVRDDSPFWETVPIAVGLALTTGSLMVMAHLVMVVGPRLGEWLAGMVHLSGFFVLLWRYARWVIAVGFAVIAIALMVWLYWTGFAILLGAELNTELTKVSGKKRLAEN